MTPALYLTYIAVTLAFCITPGPAVMLASAQGVTRGFGAGVRTVAGMQTGNAIYWMISALGLTAVLIASELAFSVLKWAGAAYLIALGVLAIRNARKRAAALQSRTAPPLWRAPFLQGLVGQLANPKAALFFVAILPQFVTPSEAAPADMLALALTGIAIDFIVLCIYAWLAARGAALFRSTAQIIWRERLAGLAQITVGGLLATMRRVA